MNRAASGGGARTNRSRQHWPWSLVLSVGLLALIALLIGSAEGALAAVVVISVIAIVSMFRRLFASSRAFGLALANLVGIYACIFLFFVESNFRQADVAALSLGFVLPLLAFLGGSLRQRRAIEQVALSGRLREAQRFPSLLTWLVPVFAVGALTFVIPDQGVGPRLEDAALLGAMAAISGIVFLVSHDVAIFLLDTGLLFEAFFARLARLIVPAFAFLSFYSLLVILFASFYSVIDHLSATANFRIDGILRPITFPESLYFSLTTLSTVGYGDISPAGNLIRLFTGTEIVCGILLLLFGFNEIFSFAQERRRHDREGRL